MYSRGATAKPWHAERYPCSGGGEGANWYGCPRLSTVRASPQEEQTQGFGARVWGGGCEYGEHDGCNGCWLHTNGLIKLVHQGQ